MKKNKILVLILSLALCVCAVFGLSACGHEHEFGSYKTSETQHWKECECGEKSELASHTFDENNVCVCGYKQIIQSKSVMELFGSLSEIDFAKGINVNLDGEVSLEDIEMGYYTEEHYGGWETVTLDLSGKLGGELYFGLDENDKIAVNGAVIVDAVGKDNTGKDFYTIDVEAYVVVENDEIYLSYSMDGKSVGLDESLQKLDGNYMEQAGQIYTTLEELMEQIPEEAVGIMTMIGQIIDDNSDFIDDELAPLFNRIWGDVDAIINEMVEVNLESMFTVKEVEGKQEVVYDFDKIKANANKLFDLTMAEYMNETLGEGTFEEFKNGIVDVLDIKLNDMLYYIFTTDGLTIAELEAKINEIGKEFEPEFDLATALGLGCSLEEFIESDEIQVYLNKTVGEMIVMLTASSGPDMEVMPIDDIDVSEQVEELKAMIIEELDKAGAITFYDAMASMIGPSMGEEMEEQVKTMTTQMLDILDDIVDFKIVFSADGKFEKIEYKNQTTAETIEKIMEMIPKSEPESSPDYVVGSGPQVIYAETILTTVVTVGEFKNTLDVDYSAIKAEIKAAA